MRRIPRRLPRVRPDRRRRGLCASLEALESRIALSTFNVDSESQLRSALASADSNGSASNTINLTSSITLTDATAGELSVDNTTGQDKTLIIQGTGTTPDQTVLSGSTTLNTGVLKIAGGVSGSVTVIVKNLTITGGQAHGGGGGLLGDSAAQGGGVSITGGKVTLSKVVIQGNNAIGANGKDGAAGADGSGATPPKPGANGTNGAPARGGGIYMRGGTLTLTNTVVQYNVAQGGRGGNGGAGRQGRYQRSERRCRR